MHIDFQKSYTFLTDGAAVIVKILSDFTTDRKLSGFFN